MLRVTAYLNLLAFAMSRRRVFVFLFAGVTCVFLLLNISLAVFLKFCGKSRFRGAVWEVSPLLAWIFAITQLFLQLFLKGTVTPR